ncbi:hypothetical protein [Bdellovibrio sp. KM01]|uniref:hypothetical protein n=1 Tax=Bdellovibrio sp. KM01 TaxID=2748865 RepID=UPI0015EA0946|nr:hypothetical protein [Bdellovibrio sp. KM01]QLY25657.1 hypothetical protein HW988_00985 [Bdellovibrio sp. KM01]
MAEQKSSNDNNKLLAILLFLGAGILVLMSLGNDNPKSGGQAGVKKTEKFEKAVNKHLMLTNEKMEFERRRLEIENAAGSDFNSTKAQTTYNPQDSGLDLSNDSRAAEVANILGRGERKEGEPLNPNDVIQKELFNAQQEVEYSEAYKKEYARQFVENARRGGYKVYLDENYRVKQVVPLNRQPGSTDIFNSHGDAIR